VRILSILFLLVFQGFWVFAEAPSWLNLFSRAEKKTLSSYLGALNAQRSSLREDWKASEGAYREYRRNAQILAVALDRYRGDSTKLSQQLRFAGLGALAVEAAERELSVNRLLELQRAEELAFQRYGHPGPRSFITAEGTEKELETQGRNLSQYLGKRILKYSKKSLGPMAVYFEKEIISLPDCPTEAFKELQERAAALAAPQYRSWILALARGSPRSLALEAPVGEGTGEALGLFREAYGKYVQDYALKEGLLKILPALASASKLIDTLILSGSHDNTSVAELQDFIRTLGKGSIDRESFRRVVVGDPLLYRSFVQFSPLLWIAYTQMGDQFVPFLALDDPTVRSAVMNLYEVFQSPGKSTGIPSVTVDFTIQGVVDSDAFADRVLDSSDSLTLIRLYSSFWADKPARNVFFRSLRYASARLTLLKNFLMVLAPLVSPAEATLEWGASGELVLSARLKTAVDGGPPAEKAIAPKELFRALTSLRFLMDTGIFVVTYPSIQTFGTLEPNEWAMAYDSPLGDPSAVPSETWTQGILDSIGQRYGISPVFLASAEGTPYPATLRYALISGTPLRLGNYLKNWDGQ
jgi:hypothetical protein